MGKSISQTPERPQPGEKASLLFRDLLEYPAFRSAPVLSAILQYLWDHQAEPVTEYAIAVDALGRPSNFDPKTDAGVRVLIGRLRARLREFNVSESYPLRLSIPVGTHELRWAVEDQQREPAAVPSASAPGPSILSPIRAQAPQPPVGSAILIAMTAALTLLLGASLLLLQQNHRVRAEASKPAVPRFWASFLGRHTAPLIVLPSLVHFGWPAQDIAVRDPNIPDFADWSKSSTVRELSKRWGPPQALQDYLGYVDVQAGTQVLKYLTTLGYAPELIDSGRFQRDAASSRSAIFIGSPYRITYLDEQLAGMDFHLSDRWDGPALVYDTHPEAGKPAEYREVDYSATHRIIPSLAFLLPPAADGGRTLILLGKAPAGLTSMFVNGSGLERLEDQWRRSGSPASWQMVVNEELNQDTVLKIWPVAMRPIHSAPKR